MAAANAQIGVAQSAYYPTVSINTSGGFESESIGNWFSVLGRFWSAGIAATQTLFDGGLRQSQVESAVRCTNKTQPPIGKRCSQGIRK
jgi:outer membrane protein TolC